MVTTILLSVPALGILALIFMAIKSAGVSRQDPGNELMQRIGKNIADGAMAFLKAEYRVLAIFVVVVAVSTGPHRQRNDLELDDRRGLRTGGDLFGPGRLHRHERGY